ncbi:MAG: RsmG family class I SAM-dependent methyltransferase [Myxococcota bacterium]|nr:RsmG family class I SAM-dependent methyltransferase [Myxococcota bacterium]
MTQPVNEKRWQGLCARLSNGPTPADPTPLVLERLNAYFAARDQWSQVHNIGGPRALAEPSDDLVDVMALSALIDQSLPLIDVGSGGGIPGLLLACLHSTLEVHLVEPAAKRCAFLQNVAHQLKLSKVKVHRARWPASVLSQGTAAQLVSRAVVSPSQWPVLAATQATVRIFQYLAAERPAWQLADYQLTGEVSYQSADGHARLLRRWDRERMSD